METTLIFGVTGQDGSYLAEFLLQNKYKAIGVVRRCSHSYTERLTGILDNENFHIIEGDITDYSSVLNIINKYKPVQIYNLAAQSHVHTSFSQPGFTWDVTGKGVLNILEVIRFLQNEGYKPRFYQASSSEMFGDQHDLAYDGNPVQYEKTRMNPQSPYAIAKLAGYNLVRLYRKSYGIFASNGILFNHESPRRGENFVTKKVAKYVGRMYRECGHKIDSGTFISPYPKLNLGNLFAQRDWGHAKDMIEGMWLILHHKEPDDFVLATGETHSVEEFVEEAFNYIGLNWKDWVNIDRSLYRPSEVPYLRGYAGKAKKLLGWEPKIKFKDLVCEMVQYEIDNNRQ